MLGYAESPADLALGRVTGELRTGDVARRTTEGLFEIVGRRNRFAKIFGLRVDLDQTESVFAASGVAAYCAEGEDRLVVAVDVSAKPVDCGEVQRLAKEHLGLPRGAVLVAPMAQVPRLPTGKPDYRAIAQHPPAPANPPVRAGSFSTTAQLRTLYAEVLHRHDVTDDDTFVSLEGDSLSYVEMSIRLEDSLGHLPPNWHVTSIGELVPSTRRRRQGFRSVETNVLLRALAIVLIVGSHANLFMVMGGAHVLLGIAGFNFGRFHLTTAPRAERVKHLATSVARIAVPSMLWLALAAALSTKYSWQNVLLLNGVLGSRDWSTQWHYWFIEAMVYTLVALTLLMAVPAVARIEARWPFWLPMVLAGLGLLTRYEVVEVMGGDVTHRANVVFWLFALGWATVKATSNWQRMLVSALVVLTVPGFFGDASRDTVVVVGALALIWVRAVSVPSSVARVAGVLASASLYIYLAHWQIYPHLEDGYPLLATILSLLGGIALWRVASWASPYVDRLVSGSLKK